MLLMAKSGRKADRHKKTAFTLRLEDRLRDRLEILADRNATDITTEIVIAIRERLERSGLWPPPPPPPEPPTSKKSKGKSEH